MYKTSTLPRRLCTLTLAVLLGMTFGHVAQAQQVILTKVVTGPCEGTQVDNGFVTNKPANVFIACPLQIANGYSLTSVNGIAISPNFYSMLPVNNLGSIGSAMNSTFTTNAAVMHSQNLTTGQPLDILNILSTDFSTGNNNDMIEMTLAAGSGLIPIVSVTYTKPGSSVKQGFNVLFARVVTCPYGVDFDLTYNTWGTLPNLLNAHLPWPSISGHDGAFCKPTPIVTGSSTGGSSK